MIRLHHPLLAALLLSAGLLTACNNDDPAAPATPPPAATAVEPGTPAAPAVGAEGAVSGSSATTAAAEEPKPAPKPRPKPASKPVERQPAPEPQARVICHDCGTVSSINPVTRQGEAGAMGTLGGAVVGGIIGHQFGGGRGKDLATVAGAAGGAFAGREIEKRARATTVYEIGVRMEDGGHRTVTVADPAGITVGSRVRVDGNNLIPR